MGLGIGGEAGVRRCFAGAGILDVCPCVSLTVRERAGVVRYLARRQMQTQTEDRVVRRYIDTGLFRTKLDSQGRQCLRNECHAYSTAKSQVTLTSQKVVNCSLTPGTSSPSPPSSREWNQYIYAHPCVWKIANLSSIPKPVNACAAGRILLN